MYKRIIGLTTESCNIKAHVIQRIFRTAMIVRDILPMHVYCIFYMASTKWDQNHSNEQYKTRHIDLLKQKYSAGAGK